MTQLVNRHAQPAGCQHRIPSQSPRNITGGGTLDDVQDRHGRDDDGQTQTGIENVSPKDVTHVLSVNADHEFRQIFGSN
jgi:hypothetical protein